MDLHVQIVSNWTRNTETEVTPPAEEQQPGDQELSAFSKFKNWK